MKRALNGEIDVAVPDRASDSRRPGRGWKKSSAGWAPSPRRAWTRAPSRERIRTFSLRYEKPFTWATFTQCMEVLTAMRGPDLLRVKGLVNVEGRHGPSSCRACSMFSTRPSNSPTGRAATALRASCLLPAASNAQPSPACSMPCAQSRRSDRCFYLLELEPRVVEDGAVAAGFGPAVRAHV